MTTEQAGTIINLLGTLVYLGVIVTALVVITAITWLTEHDRRNR